MASFYKAHPHRPYSEIGPKDKFDFYMLPLACMTYNGGLSPPPMAAVQLWTHPLEFCRSLDDIIPCCFLVLFVQSGMFRPYIANIWTLQTFRIAKLIRWPALLQFLKCTILYSGIIFKKKKKICCLSFVTQRCSPNFFTQIFQFGNMFRPGLCLFCY